MTILPVSHYRYITEPEFASEVNRYVMLQQGSGESFDFFLQCRKDGACCAIEPLAETGGKVQQMLTELGFQLLGTRDE